MKIVAPQLLKILKKLLLKNQHEVVEPNEPTNIREAKMNSDEGILGGEDYYVSPDYYETLQPKFNVKVKFQSFFDDHPDFLQLTKKFNIENWETVLKNPSQENEEKFYELVRNLITEMIKVLN